MILRVYDQHKTYNEWKHMWQSPIMTFKNCKLKQLHDSNKYHDHEILKESGDSQQLEILEVNS